MSYVGETLRVIVPVHKEVEHDITDELWHAVLDAFDRSLTEEGLLQAIPTRREDVQYAGIKDGNQVRIEDKFFSDFVFHTFERTFA